MTDEKCSFPLIEWSEVDCHLMEQDGWIQDGVRGDFINYRRPSAPEVETNHD